MAVALASRSQTLAASLFGVGRNVYLSEKHFWIMIGAATLLHVMVLAALSLWPSDNVQEIPVRALNLKLGGMPEWQSAPVKPAPVELPAPIIPQIEQEPAMRVEPPKPAPKDVTFKAPEPPKPKAVSTTEKVTPKRIKIQEPKKPEPKTAVPQNNLPRMIKGEVTKATAVPADPVKSAPLPPLNATPRQYVRASSAPNEGSPEGVAEGTESEIKKRYEQKISLWLAKHKHYPAAARMLGQHGRPILRIRVDRQGNIKFSAIDQSTGYRLIDDAALEMVKRANPLPAPPANYPGEQLLEFLIPVTFGLHQ